MRSISYRNLFVEFEMFRSCVLYDMSVSATLYSPDQNFDVTSHSQCSKVLVIKVILGSTVKRRQAAKELDRYQDLMWS